MKNYLIYACSFLLCFVFFPEISSQSPFGTPEYNGSTGPAARILSELTLDGLPLEAEDWIGAFEIDEGNVVGTGKAFIVTGGPFVGKSFINFPIFGDEGGVNQLSEGECFTFKVFDASENEILIVSQTPNPCDPRTCDNNGCTQTIIRSNKIQVSSVNKSFRAVPTEFGGFVNTGDPAVYMGNWGQTDQQPGGNFEILPVTYSSITITNNKCKSVSFDWSTSSEIDNEGFYIERQVQGERGWTSLGFMEGNGTTARSVDYSFTDEEITEDKSVRSVYYRLKQVDFNGRIEYSDTKSIRLNCGNESILTVFPNPVHDIGRITLNHEGLKDDMVWFKIHSLNGQILAEFVREVSDKDIINFNTSDFPDGLYRIQAITKNQAIAHSKFIKN